VSFPYSDHECRFVEDGSEPGVLRSRCEVCGTRRTMPLSSPHEPDARAQLWARVYATVLGSIVNTAVAEATGVTADHARRVAVGVANYAVADFDEHYLGGKG